VIALVAVNVAALAVWFLRLPPEDVQVTPEFEESFWTLAVRCNGCVTVTPPRTGDNDTVMVEAALLRFGALLVCDATGTLTLLALAPLCTDAFVALQPAMPITTPHKTLTGSGIRIRQSSSFDGYAGKQNCTASLRSANSS